MIKRRRLFLIAINLSVCFLFFTLIADNSINRKASLYLTDQVDDVIPVKTGLLLGTSKNLNNGQPNEYFFNRIDAAVELFKKGKIRYIIVSGDNGHESYNEPMDMKVELMKNGVPDSVIYPDYAGFRTFDSVIRSKAVFGQDSIVIISQKFHNERAVFIARKHNISAFGYNAKDVSAFNGFKTQVREYLARDKVFFDMWFGVEPRFLGERVVIN